MTTLRYIPEDDNTHNYRREKLKSYNWLLQRPSGADVMIFSPFRLKAIFLHILAQAT
jgi:hypothetical protein